MKKLVTLMTLTSITWSIGGGYALAASIREEGARSRLSNEAVIDQATESAREQYTAVLKSGRYGGANAGATFRADYIKGIKKLKADLTKEQTHLLSASDAEIEFALDQTIAQARTLGNEEVIASLEEQRARGVSARQILSSVQAEEWEARSIAAIENLLADAGGSPNKLIQKELQKMNSKLYVRVSVSVGPGTFILAGALMWGLGLKYGATAATIVAGKVLFSIGCIGLGIWIILIAVSLSAIDRRDETLALA